MPFIANTPESLVGRSDSKNPATTCRGITSGGRPCRRPISASDANQLSRGVGGARHSAATGRIKNHGLRVDDPRDERLYCWQHKDQAAIMTASSSPGPRVSSTPSNYILEERTSLDTLADRLNLLNVNSGRKKTSQGPAEWSKPRPKPTAKPTAKPKQTTSFFCCFRVPIEEKEDESPAPVRPRPRPVQPARPATSSPGRKTYDSEKLTVPAAAQSRPSSRHSSSHSNSHGRRPSSNNSRRPSAASFSSQTAHYLSLIPPSTSPNTASVLMAELAKPISQGDEAGYIYMFWVTPASAAAAAGTRPPAEAARALLSPPRPSGQRRPSDVVASFAEQPARSTKGGAQPKKTLLLKIGRANNVHRRLNEWTRQCGDDLTLIRYYPYVPSGSSPGASPMRGGGRGKSATDEPRKIPHSHKVERLVHLELAGASLRVKPDTKKCGCGREHREWFEVDATRAAVAAVDEVIRRWSDWDEGL